MYIKLTEVVRKSIGIGCLACTVLPSTCQVFIADQGYRESLNHALPGIVDASGYLNTDHPGIPDLDSLSIELLALGPIELNGLEHLTALGVLRVSFSEPPGGQAAVAVIPACPSSLHTLSIMGNNDSLAVIGLPPSLEEVSVYAGVQSTEALSVSFPDLNSHIERMYVDPFVDIHWPGVPDIDLLFYSGATAYVRDLVAPSATVEELVLQFVDVLDLDLSALTATRMTCSGQHSGPVSWPTGVTNLSYDMNNGTTGLSSFPPTLDTLFLDDGWPCIPPLPSGLRDAVIRVFPSSCLPNWPPLLDSISTNSGTLFENTVTYCSVLNSECPGAYPALAGVVRMDLNNNGTVDADEPIVPSSTVTIAPGGQSTGCLADGSWQIGVPPGEHTITAASAYPFAVSVSPVSHAGSVPAMGDVDLNNDFALAVLSDIQDLRVHVYADPARPGFDNQVHLHCENYGTTPVDAELNLAFDADQTWLSSSVAPTSTSSNTATWNFPAMPIGAVQHIVVELNTAASVPLGTDITHTLTADPITTDETPSDNTYTFNDSVVGSYDPNDKLLSPAVLTPDEVALGETPIGYIIRFQNTGTYLAERVVILDTLSNDLQWESMRFIASSHDQHWYIVDGVLYVVYSEIMLPDSNANEAASHGFFKFSMLPKTDLVNGSTIENIAHIVFDFNAPIVTPPAVFTVDIGAGVEAGSTTTELRILPNPAHDRIQLIVDDATVLPYRILDLLGQEVQRGAAQPNAWIDVQALDNGSYLLEVTNAGVPTSLRFMKQ